MQFVKILHRISIVLAMGFCLFATTGCDRTKEAAGGPSSNFAWNAQLNGNGKDVTGGGFSVEQQPYVEQLEKGNGAKVNAQMTAAGKLDILPSMPKPTPATATVCPGGVCPAPVVQSREPAWYNGFLP